MNNSRALNGMTVLVTRPQHQAEHLCKMITAQGGHVLRLPTVAIEPLLSAEDCHAITTLAQYDIAVFVSANAVSYSLPLMQRQWPDHVLACAVGNATAKALRMSGVAQICMPESQFNSEALLQLSVLQQVKDRKIMLFRGEGGRKYLAIELRKRGAYVREIICYRRTLPQVDQHYCQSLWQDQQIDVIVCTSVTGMQNLFILLGSAGQAWLQHARWSVISERMLSVAQTLGIIKKPSLASLASDEAIIQTLKEIGWSRKQH